MPGLPGSRLGQPADRRARRNIPIGKSLCASIPGQPLPADLWPPEDLVSLDEQNAYAERLRAEFLRPRRYATELGWAGDAHWRLSGDLQGCPSQSSFATFGVHLLVRVWYSPEVVDWLCGDRSTEIPVGAMVVKEEHFFQGDGVLTVDREDAPRRAGARPRAGHLHLHDQAAVGGVGRLLLGRGECERGRRQSAGAGSGRSDRTRARASAAAQPPYFPDRRHQRRPLGAGVYTNFGYGMYCVNCHSVAQGEPTFSSLDNILGNEAIFSWRGPGIGAALRRRRRASVHRSTRAPATPRSGRAVRRSCRRRRCASPTRPSWRSTTRSLRSATTRSGMASTSRPARARRRRSSRCATRPHRAGTAR